MSPAAWVAVAVCVVTYVWIGACAYLAARADGELTGRQLPRWLLALWVACWLPFIVFLVVWDSLTAIVEWSKR